MLAHIIGRALGHDLSATIAAFRPQVDQPVAGADHVQVVLDHHQRMAGIQQLAQRAHQLGDVVEVQAGGRLVEQEQRALARQALPALGRGLGGVGQKARQFQPLRLAAAQRRHRLAQLHVIQTHIHDGLERA